MINPPFRAMRESTKLTLREVARRAGMNSGRLSVIERGLTPTDEERAAVLAVLLPIISGDKKGDA